MKLFALIWIILSAVFAFIAILFNLEPAASIIDLTASRDGSYYIVLPFGGTFIICVLPLFIIMFINNFLNNRKNQFPTDLSGKTGIVIKREKELSGGALLYDIKIDGVKRSKLGMGKKIFIEIPAGDHTLQTWMGKAHSPELPLHLEAGQVLAYTTKVDFNKSVLSLTVKGEMLLLTPCPLSSI